MVETFKNLVNLSSVILVCFVFFLGFFFFFWLLLKIEGKKLLESSTLTHTSEEPEAQVWAKIGTMKYGSPPKQGKDSAADGAGGLLGGNAAEQTQFSD